MIVDMRRNRSVCLMCRGAFPWKCHRNYLSDVLRVLGVEVVHIIDEQRVLIHRGTKCFNYIENKIRSLWHV